MENATKGAKKEIQGIQERPRASATQVFSSGLR